jgi:glycine/D-amino acid oxidase-like deaminating enzyme
MSLQDDPRARLPDSMWARTTTPAIDTPTLAGDVEADVVVVGAGYWGLSAALHAAERRARVVVLEAAEPGWGASGRHSGHVIPALSKLDPDDLLARLGPDTGRRFIELVRDCAALTFDVIRRHRIDCDAVSNGWLNPAHRPSRVAVLQRRFDQWRRFDAAVELLDRDATAAVLGTSVYYGALLATTGGHLQPLSFARGLARAVVDVGGSVHGDSPVVGIARDGKRWRVSTPRGNAFAPAVVIATNAYGATFARSPWPGLAQTVMPVTNWQMATAPVPPALRASILPRNSAMSDTRGDLRFYRFDRDGRLISGATIVSLANARPRLERIVGARMRETFPALAEWAGFGFEAVWSGELAMTPGFMPRFFAPAPGIYAAAGCNGRGVGLGLALGRMLADAALGAPIDQLPLPVSRVAPIPLHRLIRPVARSAMLYYRHLDARD